MTEIGWKVNRKLSNSSGRFSAERPEPRWSLPRRLDYLRHQFIRLPHIFGEDSLNPPLSVDDDGAQVVADASGLLRIGPPKHEAKLFRDGRNVDQFSRGKCPMLWIGIKPCGVGFENRRSIKPGVE